jgi:cell division protein YceG involved in septum cleavage
VLLARTYKNFDSRLSLKSLTAGKEGYLFPDTYFFFPSAGTAEIVGKLEENFALKIADYVRG